MATSFFLGDCGKGTVARAVVKPIVGAVAIDVAPAAKADIVWQGSDALRLKLGGTVSLDSTDDEDKQLFDSLTPGSELELRVAVVVVGAGINWTRDKAGDASAVVGWKALAVESVWPSD